MSRYPHVPGSTSPSLQQQQNKQQQRFVQFSPTAPMSIPSRHTVADSPLQQPMMEQPFFHHGSSAPPDFPMMDELVDPYHHHHHHHHHGQQQLSHHQSIHQTGQLGQGVAGTGSALGSDIDDPQNMRRIHTSPSSLHTLEAELVQQPRPQRLSSGNKQHRMHPYHQPHTEVAAGGSLPRSYDTGASGAEIMNNYYRGARAAVGGGGAGGGATTAVLASTHPLQSSGVSSTSLSSLSPSSSSSSLSTLPSLSPQHPLSTQQAANVALMEQGMRRIKSSPTLSQPLIPASHPGLSNFSLPVAAAAASASGPSRSRKTLTANISNNPNDPKHQQQVKAARRLARKAEAARASRRRKKAYVTGLEEKVNKLNQKLELIQRQSKQQQGVSPVRESNNPTLELYNSVEQVHREEQTMIKQKLMALLQEVRAEQHSRAGITSPISTGSRSPSSSNHSSPVLHSSTDTTVTTPTTSTTTTSAANTPTPIPQQGGPILSTPTALHEDLKQLVEHYISNSHKRQNTVDLYLSQLERALLPSVAVKFTLWGLNQTDDFYANDGLWTGVMGREVGLSPAQLQALLQYRQDVSTVIQELNVCVSSIQILRQQLHQHLEERHRCLDDIMSVLTPTQLAAFCLWVESNPLCMQMLETVWQSNHGEQQRST